MSEGALLRGMSNTAFAPLALTMGSGYKNRQIETDVSLLAMQTRERRRNEELQTKM